MYPVRLFPLTLEVAMHVSSTVVPTDIGGSHVSNVSSIATTSFQRIKFWSWVVSSDRCVFVVIGRILYMIGQNR